MIGNRIAFIAASIAVILIVLYAAYQARFLIAGPSLSIDTPADGETVSSPLMTVSGRANNAADLYLNGRQIFTDEYGVFSESLLLHPGHTIIEMHTKDKFGRERTETRDVIYLTPAEPRGATLDTTAATTSTH